MKKSFLVSLVLTVVTALTVTACGKKKSKKPVANKPEITTPAKPNTPAAPVTPNTPANPNKPEQPIAPTTGGSVYNAPAVVDQDIYDIVYSGYQDGETSAMDYALEAVLSNDATLKVSTKAALTEAYTQLTSSVKEKQKEIDAKSVLLKNAKAALSSSDIFTRNIATYSVKKFEQEIAPLSAEVNSLQSEVLTLQDAIDYIGE